MSYLLTLRSKTVQVFIPVIGDAASVRRETTRYQRCFGRSHFLQVVCADLSRHFQKITTFEVLSLDNPLLPSTTQTVHSILSKKE